ncbi:hypothetical protein AB0B25_30705 [Nocardia sp. NPDC049190]|uniref:hypothetical protein n=1 Tax=Nocardia sp. NPDC049190 TaxID=3155650 RepID=UPI00340698C6
MSGSGGEVIASMLQAVKRLADALVGKAAPKISETLHEFPDTIRDGLGRFAHQDEQGVSEIGRAGSAMHGERYTGFEKWGIFAPEPLRGPDPTLADGFLNLPIEEQIRRLEHAHGIRTDAQRALELSLYVDDIFRDIAYISRHPRPETVLDGPEGWASWLDSRLFARQNLHREMSVDLMAETHRRLRIRQDPEKAGQMTGIRRWGWGVLSRPPTLSELHSLKRRSLVTYVPGPFRTEPYGVVLQPRVAGQPGGREVRWLDAPPTQEDLAAINDDPLLGYVAPGVPGPNHGVILYPNFGSLDNTRDYHRVVCDIYNDARRETSFQTSEGFLDVSSDPYVTAAQLQQNVIFGHSWSGDGHGRHSRILMNFALEQQGIPPSAAANFDHDMLEVWRWDNEVEAGSDRYAQWQDKLERSGADIDPVDLFDLRPMMQRYQQSGEPDLFTSGELDPVAFEQLHHKLRSPQ